jgi:hypothetical protein
VETCYKCHTPLSQGKIFCPECGAPLIRVNIPEPPAISESTSLTAAETVDSPLPVAGPQAIQWRHALRATIPAAVIGTTFMFFPIGIGIAGMIASGALSAMFYYHRASNRNLGTGTGAKLGALTGFFGGVLTSVCMIVALRILGDRIRAELVARVDQYATQAHDPAQLEWINYFKTPNGLTTILVAGMIFTFLMFLAFATIGGALGALWVKRRHRS